MRTLQPRSRRRSPAVARAEKQRRYAWSKYFQLMEEHHRLQIRMLHAMRQLDQSGTREEPIDIEQPPVKSIPERVTKEIEEMMGELKKDVECPICLDTIQKGELEITGCGHKFCKTCLSRLDTCALCRNKLKKN